MAISVKHKFTSLKADGPDTTRIRPSNWNDTHDFLMATNRILGRTTAAAGAVEELTVGAGLVLGSGTLTIDPTVTSNITTLQGQMTTANTNIGTLQGQMTTANTNITNLQAYDAAQKVSLKIWDLDQSHEVRILSGSNVTAHRNITILTGDADRTLDLTAGFGAGAVTLLNRATPAASASISFSSTLITTTYDHYMIVAEGMYATSAVDFCVLCSINNGTSYHTSGYTSATTRFSAASALNGGSTVDSFKPAQMNTASSPGSYIIMDIFLNGNDISYIARSWDNQNGRYSLAGGYRSSNGGRINNLKVECGVNITGVIKLFGVQKS